MDLRGESRPDRLSDGPGGGTLRIFAGPSRYVQGPGALDRLGDCVNPEHSKAAVLIDGALVDALASRVIHALAQADVTAIVTPCAGEVTARRIAVLAEKARMFEPTVVVAVGGGKTLDTGKGIARKLGLRIVTVPSIASNDGPTSRVIAQYDDDHRLLSTPQMAENPETVVVDTELISQAPVHFLRSGIGDAVSKWFEASACRRGTGLTPNGTRPLELPLAVAEACYRILLRDGNTALSDVERETVSPALERVIEAVVLMSGLAFENGGLSLAHSMTRGLMELEGARDHLHGLQVAYGLLVQLVHEGNQPSYEQVREFFGSTGLPVRLADLGATASPTSLRAVAEATLGAPHMANCEPVPNIDTLVAAMTTVESSGGPAVNLGVYTFSTDLDMPPQQFAAEVEHRQLATLMLTEHSHIPASRVTPYPATYGGGTLPDFYKRTYDPFVALSFAAGATTQLRIGTGICLVALRDPVHTAKEVASLDRLAGGRFVFGIGFGWNADEFENHGVRFDRRHALVREKVALMKELWSKEVASFSGTEVRLEPSWAWPKPVQVPHPPIYLGGNGPLTMRHAAEWADAWYPTGPVDDPNLDRAIPVFKEMVAEAGRDPAAVKVGIAPAEIDERRLEAYVTNGVDDCNVAVIGQSPGDLMGQLDRLADLRERVLG